MFKKFVSNHSLPVLFAICINFGMGIWNAHCQAAESLHISDIHATPGRPVEIIYRSSPDFYYILLKGSTVHNVNTSACISLPSDNPSKLIDPVPPHTTAFYRIMEIPLNDSLDTDGDGIDDVFELQHRLALDPLNTGDALEDFNGNGNSNHKDYILGLNPLEFPDTVTLPRFKGEIFPVGMESTSMTTEDFNLDGNLDAAFAFPMKGHVSIMYSRGNGTFTPGRNIPVGSSPRKIFSADLNRDGLADLITTNFKEENLAVLTARDGGLFDPPFWIPLHAPPDSMAFGDINQDNHLDAIVALHTFTDVLHSVAIMLGDGNGVLSTSALITMGDIATHVVLNDINNDAKLDLVAAIPYSFAITARLGNGDGTFQKRFTLAKNVYSPKFTMVDVNKDGHVEIVTTDPRKQIVGIYTGLEKDEVQLVREILVVGVSDSVNLTDFNGDGLLDFIAPRRGLNDIAVYLSENDGTYSLSRLYSHGIANRPSSIAVTDVNGDQITDAVIFHPEENSFLSVLLGRGDGKLSVPDALPIGLIPALLLKDIDGDDWVDLVGIHGVLGQHVFVAHGQSGGTFSEAQTFPTLGQWAKSLKAADFNEDGLTDVLFVQNDGIMGIILNKGDRLFTLPKALQQPTGDRGNLFGKTIGFDIEDVDGNGHVDFMTANDVITFFWGRGDGVFFELESFEVEGTPQSISLNDYDKDGQLDVAVTTEDPNTITLLFLEIRERDYLVKEKRIVPLVAPPQNLFAEDFNRDGNLDLVMSLPSQGAVAIALGLGTGLFLEPLLFPAGNSPGTIALGDFNLDNNRDIAAINTTDKNIAVLLGKGDGSFSLPRFFATGPNPISLASADLDKDGMSEIVVGHFELYTKVILFNQ